MEQSRRRLYIRQVREAVLVLVVQDTLVAEALAVVVAAPVEVEAVIQERKDLEEIKTPGHQILTVAELLMIIMEIPGRAEVLHGSLLKKNIKKVKGSKSTP